MYKKIGHPFYMTGKWKACRKAYMAKHHYICERCGRPADVVHHKIPLCGTDYYDNPEKCFGEDNLECLCHQCHNREHRKKQAVADGYIIDMETGDVEISPPVGDKKFPWESR